MPTYLSVGGQDQRKIEDLRAEQWVARSETKAPIQDNQPSKNEPGRSENQG